MAYWSTGNECKCWAAVTHLLHQNVEHWHTLLGCCYGESAKYTSLVQFLCIQGLGFALLVVCLIDVLLGFQAMRTLEQESKEFTREMSQSKGVMMAVRSGQSFTDARSALSITEPVDETSPLKSHEEAQDSEEQDWNITLPSTTCLSHHSHYHILLNLWSLLPIQCNIKTRVLKSSAR